MKTKLAYLVLVVGFAIILIATGCNSIIAKTLFGLNGIVHMDEQKVKKKEKKYKIRQENTFLINDSLYYHTFIENNPDPARSKDFLQPLQLFVFNENGSPRLHLNNCSLPPKGLRLNIQLNAYGNFDTFPIIDTPTLALDSQFTYQKLSAYFILVGNTKPVDDTTNIKMVVFWSHFMGRQTKYLVRGAEDYYQKYKHRNLSLIYVNVDNVFYYMSKHPPNKENNAEGQ